MNAREMEGVLKQLAEMAALVYSKESFWGVGEMTLMPPAQNREIQALSKRCPFPLPASYVQFLSLHDGCLNFWPSFTLLGTKDKPKEILLAEIEDAREQQSTLAVDDNGDVTPESVAKFETPTDLGQYYFLPNHVVFGANEGGEFFMFNEKEKAGKDEYEVIHYTYDGGAYYRYPEFPTFLTSTVEQLEKRINDKGYRRKPK